MTIDDTLPVRVSRTSISRRSLLAGAAGVGASAGIASIIGSRRAPVALAQDKKTVEFWTNFTDPDLTVLKNIVQAYNQQANVQYQVNLTPLPPSSETDNNRLITAVRGGAGPDVYHMDRFTVAQNAAAGLLDAIDDKVDKSVYDGYIKFAVDEITFKDKHYGLPFDTDARALYYNKGLLQQAGVDPAEFDQSNGPVTWDRLVEVAMPLSVKDANGLYQRVGFVPWANQAWHYTYGFSWGATFYDAAKCEVTPDNDKMVAAMQWVYDTCGKMGADALSKFQTPRAQPGYPPQQGSLVTQAVAFEVTGDWMINQFKEYGPTVDYGITYLPVPTAGAQSATWSGGFAMTMPKGGKNQDGGADFIKFICGEQGQRMYTEQSRHLPTLTALQQDSSLFNEQSIFFAQKLLPTSNNRPAVAVGAKYWDELTTAYQAIYLNQAQPADALKQAKDRTNQDLQRYC